MPPKYLRIFCEKVLKGKRKYAQSQIFGAEGEPRLCEKGGWELRSDDNRFAEMGQTAGSELTCRFDYAPVMIGELFSR